MVSQPGPPGAEGAETGLTRSAWVIAARTKIRGFYTVEGGGCGHLVSGFYTID